MKNMVIFSAILLSQQSWAQNWEMNDVSYLFNLPKAAEQDRLLKVSSTGNNGELLPKALIDKMERLVLDYDGPQDDATSLRAVGMRIDPCFKYLPPSNQYKEKCHPQLRLIWQPLDKLQTNDVRTYDAAVHTFYDITEEEFKKLTSELKALKVRNAGQGVTTAKLPLQIHPAQLSPKTKAYFSDEMNKIILRYAGVKKLTRATFMKLLTPKIWWVFGGFDKKNNDWVSLSIPRHPNEEIKQDFFNDDFNNPIAMKGTMIPHRDHFGYSDDLTEVANGYGIFPDTEAGKKLIQTALITINKIENPKLHSPATMDCAHCHIAEPVQTWLFQKFKAKPSLESAYIQEFKGRHNLTNTTKLDHNKSLRSFGYFDQTPSLNQRVINESAEIADELNRRKL